MPGALTLARISTFLHPSAQCAGQLREGATGLNPFQRNLLITRMERPPAVRAMASPGRIARILEYWHRLPPRIIPISASLPQRGAHCAGTVENVEIRASVSAPGITLIEIHISGASIKVGDRGIPKAFHQGTIVLTNPMFRYCYISKWLQFVSVNE